MILLSAVQVLIKATLIIGLASIGSRSPAYYLLGDIAFYLLYKVVRRDFTYWVPVDGFLGLVASVIARVMVKFVVDFADIMQFRHPNEVSTAMALYAAVYSNHHPFFSAWRVVFFTEHVPAASWAYIFICFRFGKGESF